MEEAESRAGEKERLRRQRQELEELLAQVCPEGIEELQENVAEIATRFQPGNIADAGGR